MAELEKNKFISWFQRRKRFLIGLGTICLIIIMVIIVDFTNLILKLITIGIWGLLLFAIMYTIAFALRSYKLKLIFKSIDQNISYSTSYFSCGICFFLNELIPGRLGDFAKISFIKEQENIRLSKSVCGISIERILDLILLFSISIFALICLYYTINDLNSTMIVFGQNLQFYLALGAILIICIVILLIIIIFKINFILSIVGKISKKLAGFLHLFFMSFNEGMKSFKKHKKNLSILIY
jgi:uncharacterized protein (TIRG00374 family)